MTRASPGDVVRIGLEGGFFFAIVCRLPRYRFFEYLRNPDVPTGHVTRLKELFSVYVMDSAINRRNWKIIGKIEISLNCDQEPWFHKKDLVSGKIYKYKNCSDAASGYTEILSSYDDAKDLEAAAVWDADQVEQRLIDVKNGVPNKWEESLRLTR